MKGDDKLEEQARRYAELMGTQALVRQRQLAFKERKEAAVKCTCGWRLEKGEITGPHHAVSCPKYVP